MAVIRNIETGEVLVESDDPQVILSESERLVAALGEDGPLVYAIEGFDSVELAAGKARPYDPAEPPPEDDDRLVVHEETNTIEVYGDATPPVPGPGEDDVGMDVVIVGKKTRRR